MALRSLVVGDKGELGLLPADRGGVVTPAGAAKGAVVVDAVTEGILQAQLQARLQGDGEVKEHPVVHEVTRGLHREHWKIGRGGII